MFFLSALAAAKTNSKDCFLAKMGPGRLTAWGKRGPLSTVGFWAGSLGKRKESMKCAKGWLEVEAPMTCPEGRL